MTCQKISFLLFSLTILVVVCSSPLVQKAENEEIQNLITKVQNSKLIILDVYHNRCETCKLIEPVIEKLQTNYSKNTDIVFLKYDLSNFFTIYKSRKIAKALGLENIYKSQRYSGIVLFVDPKSKSTREALIAEYNIDKYTEIIQKRLHAT